MKRHVHLIKFVENMKNEIFGSNYLYVLFMSKKGCQKVHTEEASTHNLVLFSKKIVKWFGYGNMAVLNFPNIHFFLP